jgi:phenylalanyl-tRNA synthetase beta chain
MKLSWRFLSELVDLSGVTPEEGARLLSFHTADVEGVERVGAALDALVTAHVDAVEPHPGADRLRLCTVSYGGPAPLRVVCGAPNVAAGQVVCFAPVGTTLPNGVTLKKAKIRGVESEGMICAEDEMGLGSDHDGIVVLPAGTPVGTRVSEALGLSDAVLDVNNTGITNRPDLWGHVGFARELSAILSKPATPPAVSRARRAVDGAAGTPFPVEVEDRDACRRYLALVVSGVRNGPSPAPLRRRLEALGLRSVDLVVDLTNLAMLEQGQPLHAFDLRDVRGGVVRVRRAREGEAIKTLDGKERPLDPDDLVIADGERPLAIAGVMGGEGSGVRADTTRLLLESANFDPARVRRSSIRHGLRTDASTRFEKGLDPEAAEAGALRFLEMLLEHVPGATLERPVTDVYTKPGRPVAIDLSLDLVRRRLGLPLSEAQVLKPLEALGFRCQPRGAVVHVDVPSWRATKDVSIPEDLVEEVGRIHGYEHVRPEAPLAPMRPAGLSPARRLERTGRAVASLDLGFVEIASYAFHSEKEAEALGVDPAACVRLSNPLSVEQDRLQVTCAQNLLRAAAKNQAHEPSLRICEWTRVFSKGPGAQRPEETAVLGFLTAERDRGDDPKGDAFLALKEDVLWFLRRVGAGDATVAEAGEASLERLPRPTWLHPGRRAAAVRGSAVVALVGEVVPRTARAFGLSGRVAVAEVNLDRLLAGGLADPAYRPVPRFPAAPFDVAVIVPRKVASAAVADVLRAAGGKAVRDVALFDVFEGPGIPSGHRSLAFTVTFGDDEGTLAPKSIEKLQARALEALRKAGWTVRAAEEQRKGG